jgi:hypothetical protein
MRSKRGASHFEVVVSFILFLGFVFFLLMFVRPYKTTSLSGSIVASLYDSFEEEVHTNLTSVFLKASNESASCFYVNLSGVPFRFSLTDSLVKNISDVKKDSWFDGDELNILGDDTFYYVFISPEFNNSDLGDCSAVDNFVLGSLVERRAISYNRLVEMKDRYDNDYSDLKSELGFPEVFDFAVSFGDLPELTMSRLVPQGVDVQAREYLEEVLFENGTIVNSKFNLRVW